MNGSQTDLDSVSASPKSFATEAAGERPLTARLIKDSSRIDVDSLMNEFRRELGPRRWEKYRDSLTHFLMGKLSRAELVKSLKENLGLGGSAMRNHNTLVLSLLANAYRDAPPGTESSLAEWKATTRGGKARHSQIDSANDRLHKEILTLPVRERRRIKNIAKEAMASMKNPLVPPQPPVLVATRQAMLPHIPYFHDAQKDPRSASPASGSVGMPGRPGSLPMTDGSPSIDSASRIKDKVSTPTNSSGPGLLMDPLLGLHPGKTSGPLTWTQDIIQGLDIPLISDSHEIPDDSALATRMLGVALEHGVLGGIGAGTTDMMLAGLETYLRGIVDKMLSLRHRPVSGQDPFTATDLFMLSQMQPSEMGEIVAPLFRLNTTLLEDEETIVPASLTSRKRKLSQSIACTTPLDISAIQKLPKPDINEDAQKAALEEHEKGIGLLNQLLE